MSHFQSGYEDGQTDRRSGKPAANTELEPHASYRHGYRAGYADETVRQETAALSEERGK